MLRVTRGGGLCLQRLALRCGYRIAEICAELECSRRYFQEVFKRDIGLAPKEWMRRERMAVAGQMLAGGRSLEVVASELGFSSVNNFRREFLVHHQVGPLDFQKKSWGG